MMPVQPFWQKLKLWNPRLISDAGDVADWYRYSCWLLPGGHWSSSPTQNLDHQSIFRSRAAFFVSFIYCQQSQEGLYGHKSWWQRRTAHVVTLSFRVPNLSASHSLFKTQDGGAGGEVGHDCIGDDENFPCATNPKPCTGQCRGSVVCRYTNATQFGNRIIFSIFTIAIRNCFTGWGVIVNGQTA